MDSPSQTEPVYQSEASLLTLALVFLQLGSTAFGGPAAHIALMQTEVVQRRKWLQQAEFLDRLGAANLVPGPNSTEMAMHIGYAKQGVLGLLVAGICFIFPAFLTVMVIAALYARFGNLPVTSAVLYGLKPVIIAIIARAIWNFARTALRTRELKIYASVVLVLFLVGGNQLALIFGSGLIAAVAHFARSKRPKETLVLVVLGTACFLLIGCSQLLTAYSLHNLLYSPTSLFLYFLKTGSAIYGSGYVLLAFLRSDLVEHYHWLSSAQLLDAVSVGQITPGPLFTTATFIGFLLGGPLGAVIATVGIFLPAFVLVALTAPLLTSMRHSRLCACFLDAVNAAAIALMTGVLLQLAGTAFTDATAIIIGVIAALLLMRFKVNSMWVMLGGALTGLIVH